MFAQNMAENSMMAVTLFFLIRRPIETQQYLYKKDLLMAEKKGKRKVQEVPQSQTAALPKHQETEETDKLHNVLAQKTAQEKCKLTDQLNRT